MLLVVGVSMFDRFGPEEVGMVFHDVELLSEGDRERYADSLGEPAGRQPLSLPALDEIPPVEISRTATGFVQLEVITRPDGSVADVKVLGATPAGVYEQQAITSVRTRRYPRSADGERHLELVDFKVPESAGQEAP